MCLNSSETNEMNDFHLDLVINPQRFYAMILKLFPLLQIQN